MKTAPLLLFVVLAVAATLTEAAPSPPNPSHVENLPAEKHTGGAKEKRGALVLSPYGGYAYTYPSYYYPSYSYHYNSYPYGYAYHYGYPSYYYVG